MAAMDVTTDGLHAAHLRFDTLAAAIRTLARAETHVGTSLFYAKFVEEGTQPHTITPKNTRALFWPGAAHPVALVHHPGTKPNPFMERTSIEIAPVWVATLEAAVAAIAEGAPPETVAVARDAADAAALEAARRNAPVKRGTLRDSITLERFG